MREAWVEITSAKYLIGVVLVSLLINWAAEPSKRLLLRLLGHSSGYVRQLNERRRQQFERAVEGLSAERGERLGHRLDEISEWQWAQYFVLWAIWSAVSLELIDPGGAIGGQTFRAATVFLCLTMTILSMNGVRKAARLRNIFLETRIRELQATIDRLQDQRASWAPQDAPVDGNSDSVSHAAPVDGSRPNHPEA